MHELAECIGLWLAEGDNKTKAEVTLTNNCLELILFFQRVIKNIYKGHNKPRLYIYSPNKKRLIYQLNGFKKINYYIDERANRPYYIYRLADVKFMHVWKDLVNQFKKESKYYADILRGIFAGEGNIHHTPQCNNHRSIRISSGFKNEFIEKLLAYFKINYKYNERHREYEIYGANLDRAYEIDIASLHPEKQHKFNHMILSVKEKHYSPNFLKKAIYSKLNSIYTAKDLSKEFSRDFTRIQEVLGELKKEGKIQNVKIKDKSLWAENSIMERYLLNKKISFLRSFNKTRNITQLSNNINLGVKAIRKRLKVLEKSNLVKKSSNGWKMTEKGTALICGIDEAGMRV